MCVCLSERDIARERERERDILKWLLICTYPCTQNILCSTTSSILVLQAIVSEFGFLWVFYDPGFILHICPPYKKIGLFINELCINFFPLFLRFFFLVTFHPYLNFIATNLHGCDVNIILNFFVINFVSCKFLPLFLSHNAATFLLLLHAPSFSSMFVFVICTFALIEKFSDCYFEKNKNINLKKERRKITTHCLNDSFYFFLL